MDDNVENPQPAGREIALIANKTPLPQPGLCPPLGAGPEHVRIWFDAATAAAMPVHDGSLDSDRAAAQAQAQLAKADKTRRAYTAAVRAQWAWCARRGLFPPASGPNVAAFLASERAGGLAPETLMLRHATIRYLHRVARCPVPTGDACVSETLAGIQRAAAHQGRHKRKKRAVTVQVVQRLLAPVGDGLTGLRDRVLLLVGFAGALRRSDLAAIHVPDLESTERGFRLTFHKTKGSRAEAVMVPFLYGDTELCPVRALQRWLTTARIIDGPVCRWIWRPKRESGDDPPSVPRSARRR